MSSAPRHGGRRSLLVALLACALAASATAQHPSPPGIREDDSGGGSSGQDQKVSTAMVALLAAVVAVFVFIAASTIYLRHCTGYNYNIDAAAPSTAGRSPAGDDAAFSSSLSWWHRRRRRRGSSRGLDAEAIEAFPTMTYAEAKALRVSKQGGGALECAVCLSEFEDGDKLRLLLPRCSHAFHPDCIAEWLAGHVTCPVCRCNLQPSHNNKDTSISNDGEPAPTIPFASSVSSETAAAAWQDGGPLPVAVLIDVVTEEELRQEEMELQCIGTQRRAMRTSRSLGRQPPPTTPAQLAGRWHSMGDLERFTLRLPEHVRREMVAATASEHSSLQLHRGGERVVEGGSGRSEPLIDRPSTWQSLIGRTFSGKVPFFSASRRMMTPTSSGDGEVSSTSSYSYTRLRGRRVAAFVDVAADVAAAEGEGSTCGLDRAGVGGSGYDAKAGAASSEVAAGEEKAVGVDVA